MDLLDPEAGLIGEHDGADHRGAARHSHDVGREDRLRRHGLEVFRVTGPDLLHPDRVAGRMRAARSGARWLPPDQRAWTHVSPPWSDPVPSLDDVLELRAVVRDLHG